MGETYFFREPRSLEALRDHVLMPMLAQRRLGDQRVRIWSAGCCSGEETYSVGILLHQLLPDPAGWESMLLGTDINPAFLEKAAGGLYTEWSFRDMPPRPQTTVFHTRRRGPARDPPPHQIPRGLGLF